MKLKPVNKHFLYVVTLTFDLSFNELYSVQLDKHSKLVSIKYVILFKNYKTDKEIIINLSILGETATSFLMMISTIAQHIHNTRDLIETVTLKWHLNYVFN